MKTRGLEARPHGFRSSFRIFVAEQMPEVLPHIAEMCLGHAVAGATELAYQRSDLLNLRHPVMDAWADHVAPASAEVVQLRGGDGGTV
ncbi:MAG: hypothetical protein GXP05_16520 [Alphaproteobacteria bacterium]|nr:hypothetical protein [Alphaproteobacteria bacterium]